MMNNALATMLLNESDEALKKRKHTHTHTHRYKNPKNGSTDLYIYGYTVGLCHHTAHSIQHKTDSNSEKIETQFPFWMLEYRLYP